MTNTQTLIKKAYAAFNARDVDAALALMSDTVRWPKASEGGYVMGKEEVRAYWTRQWAEFDPHVEPLEIVEAGDQAEVRVHQVVKTPAGEVLFDGEVWHRFSVVDSSIDRMDLAEGSDAGPSAAFASHHG